LELDVDVIDFEQHVEVSPKHVLICAMSFCTPAGATSRVRTSMAAPA
jgi:hypothetical protein